MQHKNKITRDFKKYKPYSIRLRDFDYSSPGDYFITICSHNRECIFGEVKNGEMILNNLGEIIQKEILKTMEIRKNIFIEIFQVMPNHVHLIITILCGENDFAEQKNNIDPRRDTLQCVSTKEEFGKSTSNSIPTIVKLLKSASTKQINILRNTPYQPIFQYGYHEHIIRNQQSYDEIYTYIQSNPQTWDRDRNNPENFVL